MASARQFASAEEAPPSLLLPSPHSVLTYCPQMGQPGSGHRRQHCVPPAPGAHRRPSPENTAGVPALSWGLSLGWRAELGQPVPSLLLAAPGAKLQPDRHPFPAPREPP